jgi:hypothetical protein
MASTYVNDLRLNEMATGDGSGTWGTTTNTNLELIAEAFSYGTEAITTNADTHTTTIADGATDPGRSLYLKYTGTLDSACTITIGPNTVSKVWIIENGTSGSQDIILSQGSGANITIPAGDTKVVYSDGAGAGAAFFDAFASLSVVDLKVQDDLTVTDDLIVNGDIDLEGNMDVNGSLETDALSLNGTTVTSTAAEINLLDGSSANTVVNSKAVIYGSSGEVAGTLSTAAQPNITSVGTLTGFTSTGIDDNADATAITIDSSERVIVGNSSPFTADSVTIDQGGFLAIRNTGASGMEVRRDSTDGNLIDFQKDGTAVGSIGTANADSIIIGNSTGNLILYAGTVAPSSNSSGGASDGVVDLGTSARRFKDLYLSGSVYGGGSFSAGTTGNGNWFAEGEQHIFRRGSAGSYAEFGRFDVSGNFLVGKNSTAFGAAGAALYASGDNDFVNDSNVMSVNRLSTEGSIISFYKDGAAVGSINTEGSELAIGSTAAGLQFLGSEARIRPFNITSNTPTDNTIDLGRSNSRFQDIYATNGTINTSDRNEKQDIESLTDAENRVAVAAKGLLRKFRWKDAVAEKGDNARTHFGIIAQDLQDAFTAESLDAGDYAMFISSTWWETQTEVAAVEAVEEVTDEEGNVTTEAVEAKDAYTRTDTYDTAEEAPEGATERTRLGVRYSELLAFIIAAI